MPKMAQFWDLNFKFLKFPSYPREFPVAGGAGDLFKPNRPILAKSNDVFSKKLQKTVPLLSKLGTFLDGDPPRGVGVRQKPFQANFPIQPSKGPLQVRVGKRDRLAANWLEKSYYAAF